MSRSGFDFVLVIFTIFNVALCGYAAQSATNSVRNKTQAQNDELSARDQSNSPMDIEITRNIRRRVVAEKTFSGTAKNIKIITKAGGVTLKGPVQSTEEKDMIYQIAVEIAGRQHVSNELEVVHE